MRLALDCETDGFLREATTVHSLVLYDLDTGEMFSCANQPGYKSIDSGIALAHQATEVWAHNGIKFDYPVLTKLAGLKLVPDQRRRDSLIAARLIWPDLKPGDTARWKRDPEKFPSKLIGAHKLQAWGVRMGIHKGDFGENTDWKTWTPEMQTYCEQDVRVMAELIRRIEAKNTDPRALDLEHAFAEIIFQQEQHGFPFDEAKAAALYAELAQRRLELQESVRSVFKPWWQPGKLKVSKRAITYKTPFRKDGQAQFGTFEGGVQTEVTYTEFSPSSRDHIASRLKALYNWQPVEFTGSGKPKVDDDVLSALPYPEAQALAEFFTVEKRLGQLAEGDKALLKLVRDGHIHGEVNTNGAVTGRCTHHNPNVAQTPTNDVPYGRRFRECYRASEKLPVVVGADASGLELRCLAHFMARYDDGAYVQAVTEGDVHWTNATALGLIPAGTAYDAHNDDHLTARNKVAKRFIYAFLYGAGGYKLGTLVAANMTDDEAREIMTEHKRWSDRSKRELEYLGIANTAINRATCVRGYLLKASFLKKLPALKNLIDAVQAKVKSDGAIRGIDGRIIPIRSAHSALNTLLQSAGGLLVKQATVFLIRDLEGRGMRFGQDYALVAHIHDELQLLTREDNADEVGQAAVAAFKLSGEFFSFRCPITGEYRKGRTWADTH